MLAKEITPFFHKGSPLSVSVFQCVRQIPPYPKDVFELLLCLKGELEVYSMHERHVLLPGDIMQADTFDIHTIANGDPQSDALAVSFHFDLTHPLFAERDAPLVYYVCSSDDLSFSQRIEIGRIRLLLLSILTDHIHERHTEQIPLMTKEVLLILRDHFQYFDHINVNEAMVTKEMRQRFERIMSYMLAHYDEKITMRDICDMEHISYNYLSRFFKDSSLKTFRNFLHELRVYHSEHLLLCHPELSVPDIGYRIGFSDPKFFYREFRKKHGHTPHQHRIWYRRYNENVEPDEILDVQKHPEETEAIINELYAQTVYAAMRRSNGSLI